MLQDIGYPTDVLVLDFETYFDGDYSLKKMSTIEYICDRQFEVLGLAVLESTEPDSPRFYRGPDMVDTYLKCIREHWGPALPLFTVVAMNATFDLSILRYRYGITPSYPIDLLGLARAWNARAKNDLGTLAKRYHLPMLKGDTNRFKGWTTQTRYTLPRGRKKGIKLPTPRPKITATEWPDLEKYALDDARIEWQLFQKLLPRWSNPRTEARAMKHTLELFTRPCLKVDAEKASELKTAMLGAIDRAVEPTGLTREDVSRDTSFEARLRELLEDAGETPGVYTKPAKNAQGWKFAIAKDDPEREQLENHADPRIRTLMAARAAVKSWPLHIARIDRIVRQAAANHGVLPVPLKYHGAHTARWSGGEKINLQNLGSRGHALVSAIRELLIAPPGHELVIADASQIEARVLAWVAGQWDLVEKFARGDEIYCGFASRVLGIPVRKPRADGIPVIEARHRWARNSVGKVGVLGCGYGMGPHKAATFAGGAISVDMAERIVIQYRAENQNIVQFWKDVEKCFLYTAQHRRPCEMPRGLRFDNRPDCDVVLILPNGRELHYHDVRVTLDTGYGPSAQVHHPLTKTWDHVWGGHLTENVVQAISRDILWGAIDRMEQAGYRVALHVHDELVACVQKGRGDDALAAAIQFLSERPQWASGLPLAAEGVVTSRYGGH